MKQSMLDVEEWKDIKDYEGYYQVSNRGRVKSLYRKVERKDNRQLTIPERIMKLSVNRDGYKMVGLNKYNIRYHVSVHLLVADAFLPPRPSEDLIVTFVTADRSNINAENLRWGHQGEWQRQFGERIIDDVIHAEIERLLTRDVAMPAIANKLKLELKTLYNHCHKTRLSASPSNGGITEPGELWVDIIGWEGMYQFSSLGRVKRLEYEHLINGEVHKRREQLIKVKFCRKRPYHVLNVSQNGIITRRECPSLVTLTKTYAPIFQSMGNLS